MPHLRSNSYAPWVLIIQQQPLGPEASVIRVVTFCRHISCVAHHVQRNHIQQSMTGCMQAISEGQPCCLDALAGRSGHPDVCSLHPLRGQQARGRGWGGGGRVLGVGKGEGGGAEGGGCGKHHCALPGPFFVMHITAGHWSFVTTTEA